MASKKSLFDNILAIAKTQRRKIAIGLVHATNEEIASIKKARAIADIVVVGQDIAGFECIPASYEDAGRILIQMYKEGKIDQLVRGHPDDFGTVDEFKKLYNIDSAKKRLTTALLKDFYGREFFLTMASNPEGQTYEDKQRIVHGVCEWLKKEMNVEPRVAVMATCRPGSVGKDPVMTKSYEDAERLVGELKDRGIKAENIHIESNEGVKWCNLLVPSNGTIGNQIFRALTLYGGGQVLCCPVIFLEDNGHYLQYEDNSRNEIDWYPHIVFAAFLANK